ncbi:MAG: UTP--glucose-1-phosphate uridylyltransferase, partial [Alphaproteobacteria bacterium]|nr:UTP--glucose-1-phosphate uridylyltransferase [Alphaproteobacteria bacterium]
MNEVLLTLNSPLRPEFEAAGKKVLEGKTVAVLTLAGGVGSRLGFSGPKGSFSLETPEGKKSLFEMQARKTQGLLWVILVSPKTREKTIEHLQQKILSCTDQEPIYLIEQQEIEALGKDRETLFLNGSPVLMPNGNGAVFEALRAPSACIVKKEAVEMTGQSMLEVFRAQGIKYLNIISIDNVLVQVADPIALGLLEKEAVEIVSAGIRKRKGCSMGVFLSKQGNSATICEYTDKPTGEIVSIQGTPICNIANHLLSVDFLKRIDPKKLQYHEVYKKIQHDKEP